jgi:hypothetical protein
MNEFRLSTSRLIVGIVLILIAVWMFFYSQGDYATAGAIAIGVLGLITIAISRRR